VQPEPAYPGLHPDPPDDLATRDLPILTVQQTWYRVHRSHRDPLFFGKTRRNRFDAPTGEFGVLYVGEDQFCAFVEAFDVPSVFRPLTRATLESRRLAVIELDRPLRLVNLTGSGLARIGADERLAAGDHDVARRWSHALWSHPSQPDGLLYRARHDPSRRSAALFDRIDGSWQISRSVNLGAPDQRNVVAAILDEYQYVFVDTVVGNGQDADHVNEDDGDHSKSPSSG
jgi:hypothetical protein